jgi:hypothetical protein
VGIKVAAEPANGDGELQRLFDRVDFHLVWGGFDAAARAPAA